MPLPPNACTPARPEPRVTSGRFVRRTTVSAMSRPLDPPVRGGLDSGAGGKSAPVPTPPAEPVFDLPWSYEDDRVVLLVRDPWTLFTYWDFHPDTIKRAREALGESASPSLRLLNVSGSEPRVVAQLGVDLGWRAYYFTELEPNGDYRVEMVFLDDEGQEALVGRRSNVATLPADRPSAWVEDRFASIPIDVPLPEASVFAQGRVTTGAAPGRMHARAWSLSGGESMTGQGAGSSSSWQLGFGGRGWSASLVRK